MARGGHAHGAIGAGGHPGGADLVEEPLSLPGGDGEHAITGVRRIEPDSTAAEAQLEDIPRVSSIGRGYQQCIQLVMASLKCGQLTGYQTRSACSSWKG